MIYSWRGVGKTFAALNIAYAVASGGTFLNWSAPEPKKILYLDGEMPAIALQERLAQIVSSAGRAPEKGFFKILTPDLQPDGITPNLGHVSGQNAITDSVEDDTALIVIDNLSCLIRGPERENDAESWQNVATWALGMRARGHSILFVHHAGKGGAQRGTSKREDVLDTVLCLRRPEDHTPNEGACFVVEYEKARSIHGDDVQAIEAKLDANPDGGQCWSYRPLEDAELQRLVSMIKDGASQRECADELGINRYAIRRLRKRAHEKGLIESPNFPRGGSNE